jgi:hypothetical protein
VGVQPLLEEGSRSCGPADIYGSGPIGAAYVDVGEGDNVVCPLASDCDTAPPAPRTFVRMPTRRVVQLVTCVRELDSCVRSP